MDVGMIAVILCTGILISTCGETESIKIKPSGKPIPSNLPEPWNGHVSSFWTNDSKAVYLADMSSCEPSSALAPRLRYGYWKVIPYETTDGLTGNMVWASVETDAPEIRFQLPVKGWHAIFVGLWASPAATSKLWLKLDTDTAPVPRQNEFGNFDDGGNAEEILFKVADLQDNYLCIRQKNGEVLTSGGVVYVKLIPLTEDETARFLADCNNRAHKTMVATHDGFSPFCFRAPRTKEHLLSDIKIFRFTDFGTIILQSEAFPDGSYGMHGKMAERKDADYIRVYDRIYAETMKAFKENNINPFKVLVDGAHDMGMRAIAAIRPGSWGFWMEPFAGEETSFYKDNPQWRCVDRDGTPVARMSWAVPEVRKWVIDYMGNLVGCGADGVHILFNRGYPVVLYEEPFVDMFRAKHGEDPRKLDESDTRISAMWTEVVITFFRELREMLDEEETHCGDGRHLEISANVLGNELFNVQYGVDIKRLMDEGLLDRVYPYKWNWGARKLGKQDFTPGVFRKKYNSITYDLEYFRRVCGEKDVPFSPYFWSISDTGKRISEALEYYEKGVHGIAVWDAGSGGIDMHEWVPISRIGHIDETRARAAREEPERIYKTFHRVGEQIFDGRFPAYWGG